MTNNAGVRIGVIGCGHWGKHYLRLFSSLPGARLTAIAEHEPERQAAIRRQYAGIDVFDDHRRLITSGLVDAVVVATEASTHYNIVGDALSAGLDVLAEKPLTTNLQQAVELVALAERESRVLMVAHTFLFNPSVIQVKKYLAEAVLGDVYYLKAQRTHLGLIRQDVNAVWDLAPHDISIFLYLLNEKPVSVNAIGMKVLHSDREDAAFINMRFPSGIGGHIHVSWADANKERMVDVVGSKARVVFDDLCIQEPVRIFFKGISLESVDEKSFGEFKYLLRDGDIVSPSIPMQEPLRVLCESFLASIGTRHVPISDGHFGCDVIEVLTAIDRALKA
jgi:predicted dehydrogenase